MTWLLLLAPLTLLGVAIASLRVYETRRLRTHLSGAVTLYPDRVRALLETAAAESRLVASGGLEEYTVAVYGTFLGKLLVWVRISLVGGEVRVIVQCSGSCNGEACKIADHMSNAFEAVGYPTSIQWNVEAPLREYFVRPSERRRFN